MTVVIILFSLFFILFLGVPIAFGLGTLGLNPEFLSVMIKDAGFTSFHQHEVEDPTNLYYEIRP